MSFESFVSRRHLFSKERKALLSVITFISILGVAVGVTALIVVIGVMDGADEDLLGKIIGVFAHVEVRDPYEGFLTDYNRLLKKVEGVEGVVAAAPVIQKQALLRVANDSQTPVGVQLKGIDPDKEGKVAEWEKAIVLGTPRPKQGEVILGIILAERLNVKRVGAELYAVTPRMARTPQGPVAKTLKLRVSGIYQCGLYDVDANLAFTNLETLQNAFAMGDTVDFLHVKVNDPFNLKPVEGRLANALGPTTMLRGWDEFNPDFFKALKLEKLALFVILLLIILVAAFLLNLLIACKMTFVIAILGIIFSTSATRWQCTLTL